MRTASNPRLPRRSSPRATWRRPGSSWRTSWPLGLWQVRKWGQFGGDALKYEGCLQKADVLDGLSISLLELVPLVGAVKGKPAERKAKKVWGGGPLKEANRSPEKASRSPTKGPVSMFLFSTSRASFSFPLGGARHHPARAGRGAGRFGEGAGCRGLAAGPEARLGVQVDGRGPSCACEHGARGFGSVRDAENKRRSSAGWPFCGKQRTSGSSFFQGALFRLVPNIGGLCQRDETAPLGCGQGDNRAIYAG